MNDLNQNQHHEQLTKSIKPYAEANAKASIVQLINTLIPFILLWFLAYQSLSVSVWLSLPLSIAAAGFVVRIFIIFHDCTHMSFFKSRRMNRIVGVITGIIAHFPFEKWRHDHIVHHTASGNLDKRGVGDIWIMTVREYTEASFWRKIAYRIYRNPVILFGFGAFYLFLIDNRINRKGASRKERYNMYVTNLAIAGINGLLIWAVGWQAFLLVQVPVLYVAGTLGIWLFYVQHQFEDAYFEGEDEWDYVRAAVDGSSYYKLPKVLQWITGNIGYHHVHHLSPKVPNYQLEKAHRDIPPLQKATTISLKTSLESLRFRLFDEDNRVFISFRTYKQQLKELAPAPSPSSKRIEAFSCTNGITFSLKAED